MGKTPIPEAPTLLRRKQILGFTTEVSIAYSLTQFL
jgi:hypothetical protein